MAHKFLLLRPIFAGDSGEQPGIFLRLSHTFNYFTNLAISSPAVRVAPVAVGGSLPLEVPPPILAIGHWVLHKYNKLSSS